MVDVQNQTDVCPTVDDRINDGPATRCGDRGPRIGEDGTRCFRPVGHVGQHWAHESFDNGGNPAVWS